MPCSSLSPTRPRRRARRRRPAPEYRGGGGAARRDDDRQPAVRGRPDQAARGAFLRAATRPIYAQILRIVDKNMIANPVTLRPLFESDDAMRELGGPAYLAQLTGSGAALIGARDFASRSTTSRCCARWSASAAAWSRARWTPPTRSIPRRRSSRPRSRSTASPRRATSGLDQELPPGGDRSGQECRARA